MEGKNGRGKGEGFSGTRIKDAWTKPKWVGSRVGSGDGWLVGAEGVVGGKWRQLYLNNNKKVKKKKPLEVEKSRKHSPKEPRKGNAALQTTCFELIKSLWDF